MMKKLLIIALVLLGINSAVIAQNTQNTVKSEKKDTIAAANVVLATEVVTIESISSKIDQFVESQNETNKNLEQKIDRANRRMQDLQNKSSFRWLLGELIPILVLGIIGAFIIAVVYVIANSNYRNNMLKYDTMIKCVEKIGSVPEFFNKVERQKSAIMPIGGRVHLALSIICGIAALIFLICTINIDSGLGRMLSLGGALVFFYATFLLFKQYNQFSENSRNEQ